MDVHKESINHRGAPGRRDVATRLDRLPAAQELHTGRVPRTQLGQMCDRLGIQIIIARSPEPKGRIERNHGTTQDRLVKKMRRRQIATFEAANACLEGEYLVDHNRRFAVPVDSVQRQACGVDTRSAC